MGVFFNGLPSSAEKALRQSARCRRVPAAAIEAEDHLDEDECEGGERGGKAADSSATKCSLSVEARRELPALLTDGPPRWAQGRKVRREEHERELARK